MRRLLPICWMLLTVLVVNLTVSRPAPLSDESSLLAIKARFTSNTILAKNWSQGTSFCTWIGVICGRKHLRVTVLDLFNMGLGGLIPPQIGNLSFLTYLDLSNNSFSGQIPDEISNLRRLRVLNLRYNQLRGQLPPSLGLLSNLKFLILRGNSFFGAVPWSRFNFSKLTEMDLDDNHFSGDLPINICHHLPSIKYFVAAGNELDGVIPKSLGYCAQLKVLSLYANKFSGSIPSEIGNLSQLQYFSAGQTNLTGTIPSSLSNLSNLWYLTVRETHIHGEIPFELGRLWSLRELDFQENRLNGVVPQPIFNLSKLQALSLVHNNLSGSIPSSIDKGLPYLQSLYLGGNQFHGRIPDSISNLSGLSFLSLSFNSFTGHIPISVGNLRFLELFELGMNHFTNDLSLPQQDFVTSLANCENLEHIDFAINPLTGTLPRSIGSGNLSASLMVLIAYSCRIKGRIPEEVGNLSSLITLTIGDNEFTGMIPESLQRLKNLQLFAVYENKLEGSIPPKFCNLQNLYAVDFGENKMFGSLPSCLGSLPFLKILNFSGNSFSASIPTSFWLNKGIQNVDLSQNLFDGSIPEEIRYMESLTELYLSENQLTGTIPISMGKLQRLSDIALSNNRFDGAIPDSLADLKALEYLDLSSNKLSGSIPKSLETLPNLDHFNVSFNELSGEIPEGGNFAYFTADFFRGNEGLCGAPRFKVKACRKNDTMQNQSSNNKLLRYILPPIFSAFVAATIVIFYLYCCGKKAILSTLSNSPGLVELERISYNEIVRATNNFDEGNLLGSGSFGLVYKGEFLDEKIYAVKVFNSGMQQAFKSFDTECHIMRNIRHRHLVKVITSCSNLDFKALVMQYIPNGNLDKWLHSPQLFLTIFQRLEIMIGVASAIEYLHLGYSSPIVHCDLKPSNILVDEDMIAYVGDFGIAKLLTEDQRMEQTKTLGTIGYMAPEYGSTGIVSTMADVYSYGILLIETFTRKKPTDGTFSGEFTLTKWVSESFPDDVMQIVDASLLSPDEELSKTKYGKCLTSIIGIGLECVVEFPAMRLKMNDVASKLQKIKTELLHQIR